MNPKIKTQEEWLVMRSFRDHYKEFPKGKLTKSESPDFVLKQSLSKSIGIEVSRVFKNQVLAAHESEVRSVVHRAYELYAENIKRPVFAWIYFNDQFNSPFNQEMYATKIAIAIIDAVEEQKGKFAAKMHIDAELLPQGINRIVIYINPTIKDSFWDCRAEINISDLFEERIRKLVEQKDEKLGLYRKQIHDFYWLILYADFIDKPASYNFDKVIDRFNLTTAFHKVFLFNLFDEEIFPLAEK